MGLRPLTEEQQKELAESFPRREEAHRRRAQAALERSRARVGEVEPGALPRKLVLSCVLAILWALDLAWLVSLGPADFSQFVQVLVASGGFLVAGVILLLLGERKGAERAMPGAGTFLTMFPPFLVASAAMSIAARKATGEDLLWPSLLGWALTWSLLFAFSRLAAEARGLDKPRGSEEPLDDVTVRALQSLIRDLSKLNRPDEPPVR